MLKLALITFSPSAAANFIVFGSFNQIFKRLRPATSGCLTALETAPKTGVSLGRIKTKSLKNFPIPLSFLVKLKSRMDLIISVLDLAGSV
jgi:hypothetical protein